MLSARASTRGQMSGLMPHKHRAQLVDVRALLYLGRHRRILHSAGAPRHPQLPVALVVGRIEPLHIGLMLAGIALTGLGYPVIRRLP